MSPMAACSKTLFNKMPRKNDAKLIKMIEKEGGGRKLKKKQEFVFARFNLMCSGDAKLANLIDFGQLPSSERGKCPTAFFPKSCSLRNKNEFLTRTFKERCLGK